METFDSAEVITVGAGNVEYSAEEAAVKIDDVIEMLESAKSEGATHLVLLSGNYRGAQYVRPQHGYDWLDD